jgi:hypothetical protein
VQVVQAKEEVMQTPTRTIRKQARWLGLALVALAIAAPAANAGPGRLDIYPYESPYGAAAGGTAPVNPLAGRLHIYPYETPFGPEVLRPAASSSQPARGLLQGSGASTATLAVNRFDRLDAVAGLGLALVAVLSALAVRRSRFLGRGPRYIVHRQADPPDRGRSRP